MTSFHFQSFDVNRHRSAVQLVVMLVTDVVGWDWWNMIIVKYDSIILYWRRVGSGEEATRLEATGLAKSGQGFRGTVWFEYWCHLLLVLGGGYAVPSCPLRMFCICCCSNTLFIRKTNIFMYVQLISDC